MANLVERDIERLIKDAGGSYVEAFRLLALEVQHREAVSVPGSSVESRKQAYRHALETLDQDKLLQLEEIMTVFVSSIQDLDLDPETVNLPAEKAAAMMKIILDYQKISEFTATFREMVREVVFNVITEEWAKKGKEFPEHINGEVPVPELGMRFTKEGAGRKGVSINEPELKAALGDEVWESVCDKEVIPRQIIPRRVEHHLNLEKLMKRAHKEPALMTVIEQCLTPGGWKSPSFHTRPIQEKK